MTLCLPKILNELYNSEIKHAYHRRGVLKSLHALVAFSMFF